MADGKRAARGRPEVEGGNARQGRVRRPHGECRVPYATNRPCGPGFLEMICAGLGCGRDVCPDGAAAS